MLGIWLRLFSLGCDWSCDAGNSTRMWWRGTLLGGGGVWGLADGWCWANNGLKTWRKVKGIKAKTIHQNGIVGKGTCRAELETVWWIIWDREVWRGEGVSDISQLHLAVEHGFEKMTLYMLLLCSDLLNKATIKTC